MNAQAESQWAVHFQALRVQLHLKLNAINAESYHIRLCHTNVNTAVILLKSDESCIKD